MVVSLQSLVGFTELVDFPSDPHLSEALEQSLYPYHFLFKEAPYLVTSFITPRANTSVLYVLFTCIWSESKWEGCPMLKTYRSQLGPLSQVVNHHNPLTM